MRAVRTTLLTIVMAVPVALFTVSGQSGSTCDCGDGDGVEDIFDNCVLEPNGPLGGSCSNQEDGDSDGYGNACDTDTNNDGATGLDDVNATLSASITGSLDPQYDYNCDGGVGLDDLNTALVDAILGTPPGPSGHVCAGIPVCL